MCISVLSHWSPPVTCGFISTEVRWYFTVALICVSLAIIDRILVDICMPSLEQHPSYPLHFKKMAFLYESCALHINFLLSNTLKATFSFYCTLTVNFWSLSWSYLFIFTFIAFDPILKKENRYQDSIQWVFCIISSCSPISDLKFKFLISLKLFCW